MYKYDLIKALVQGIKNVKNKKNKELIQKQVKKILKSESDEILKGLPYVDFPKNLEVESGFFTLLDFTNIKGMKYKGKMITTEIDLLNFFYRTNRIRFLIGQSISWPYKNELIGRFTTALPDEKIITSFRNINIALKKLKPKNDYIIRKNELRDQEQMARIKIDGWRNTYDKIIAKKYLKELDYKTQTERYIESFDEYKELVLVAEKNDEILGYSCFDYKDKDGKFDSELISLYIKQGQTGNGIGSDLLIETGKELFSKGKTNMIVWCLSENKRAIKFYEKHGGKIIIEKQAKIGDETYLEYGIFFDLKNLIM